MSSPLEGSSQTSVLKERGLKQMGGLSDIVVTNNDYQIGVAH